MDIEWLRLITILLSIYGICSYVKFYKSRHEPIVFAPVSWLLLVLGFSIFKWIVGGNYNYYIASVIWNNVILIQGIIITTAALIIFRGYKPNGH